MCAEPSVYTPTRQQSSSASSMLAWIAACIVTSLPVTAVAVTPSFSLPNPCATAAPATAAPQRAKAPLRAAAKPAARKTVAVGVQPRAVRKPRQAVAHPRVAPSATKVSAPQDGCVAAPIGVPIALTALLGAAAPAAGFPQSTVPAFVVPLDAMPAVLDGPMDDGAPVLQQPVPATADGTANWPVAWLPLVGIGHPAPVWSNAGGGQPLPPQWSAARPTAQLPLETDREFEQPGTGTPPELVPMPTIPGMPETPELPGLPAMPETPVDNPYLEPPGPGNLPTAAAVPEPASLALVVLAGLIAAATQALRRRQSARSEV